jgi:hypothetical protein
VSIASPRHCSAGIALLALTHAFAHAADTLVIIAPRDFHDALAPFVTHKKPILDTELVALEDVLEHWGGVDDPERIKHFLYDRWKAGRARYALLVGDVDRLPVRYMVLDRNTEAAFNYAFYPSDLYYADLSDRAGAFEDWNAESTGFHASYFGEVRGEHNKQDPINFDQVDYRPEIGVGRWPVSTPEQLTIVVDKTIAYETSLATRDSPPVAGLVASGGWIENRPASDELASALDAWTVRKCYFADDKRDDETPQPNEASVLDLMNEGVDLLLHSGHGTDDSWHGAISVRTIEHMHNADRLPIVFSAGCSTARFASCPPYEAYTDVDGADHTGTNDGEVFTGPPPAPAPYQRGPHNLSGLGEQLLRSGPNGAVAYIGCNTGSQPCGMTLLAGFVDGVHPGARLGDCWMDAIDHYYKAEHLATIEPNESWYPASIFFQGMKFMLFGDPSLPMPR